MKIWDFDAKMILNVLDDPLDVTHRISELTLQDYTDNRNNYPGQRNTGFRSVSRCQSDHAECDH